MIASKSSSLAYDPVLPRLSLLFSMPATAGRGLQRTFVLPADVCLSAFNDHLASLALTKQYLADAEAIAQRNHKSDNLVFHTTKRKFDFSTSLSKYQSSTSDPEKSPPSQVAARQPRSQSEVDQGKRFLDLKQSLVHSLRARLLGSKFYSINELYKQAEQRIQFERDFREKESVKDKLPDLDSIDLKEFIKACSTDKYQSRAIQNVLESGPSHLQKRVCELCEQSVDELLNDKYGNYILQQAVRTSEAVAKAVESKCLTSFDTFAMNERVSRVMQALSEVSHSFRLATFTWFADKLEKSVDNLAAVFLLTSAIQWSKSREEMELIKRALFSKSLKRIRGFKYFNRIMVSFVEKCDSKDLTLVYEALKIQEKFLELLDEKLGALLVFAMVKRDHEPTKQILLNTIQNHLTELCSAKYFKYLLFQLNLTENLCEIKERMVHAVARSNLLSSLGTTPLPFNYFLAYLVASLLSPEQLSILEKLAEDLEDPVKLMAALSSLKSQLRPNLF